ncbi:MAG: zinc ribbon domain-containing protein [Bacillota bacterium]
MFASRIVCGQYGGYYGAKVWHSTDPYRRTIYQCNNKFKGKEKCSTPHLDEEAIQRLFVKAVNKLLSDKEEILANSEIVKQVLYNITDLNKEHYELQSEMSVVAGKQDGLISEFDEQLWYCLVDSVIVYTKDDVRVVFKDGTVIQVYNYIWRKMI